MARDCATGCSYVLLCANRLSECVRLPARVAGTLACARVEQALANFFMHAPRCLLNWHVLWRSLDNTPNAAQLSPV
eukprot:6200762-Pleurochrysis_carterae.AAC.1